ncbi:MAG: ABC-three component system protein [Vulcanimicrobiota bacterium]
MIKKISANKSSFKTVEFKPGFNVVWADRTKESTKGDSRNGLGKSTLIEIIHFCLGASARRGNGLLVEALKGWEFSLTIQLDDNDITITRHIDHPGVVHISGNTSSWPLRGDLHKTTQTYSINEWNTLMGYLYFGLPMSEGERNYSPTFRSLISYFIRRDKDAFSTPFEHFRKQKEWDKQVNNAYLLGLDWETASELQEMKDQKKGLEDFRKAVKSGVVDGFTGSLGDLEARKVRLKTIVENEALELDSFKVHPQYEKIQAEANHLTEEIHQCVNTDTTNRNLLDLYERSLLEEQPPVTESVEKVYEEAGIALPGMTLRRLEEVRNFHKTIIENRHSFLSSEIDRLKREIRRQEQRIKEIAERRAELMTILRTHGALEEYTLLQSRHMTSIGELNSISATMENVRTFNSRLSDLKIAQEELQKKAHQDYNERYSIRERAITLFNMYSERLYSVPGNLVINIGPTGFKFDVEIERSGSSGISNMKVFCYDMTLARLWSSHSQSPRFLVHDSTIFDGVDERQRARALEIASKESLQNGFQYICTLNSDYIPWGEFSEEFDIEKHICVRLTDRTIEGCLLGMRY